MDVSRKSRCHVSYDEKIVIIIELKSDKDATEELL